MGAGSHSVASGMVLGLVVVLLGQQFGYIDLSSSYNGILDLVIAAVVGAIVAGLVGRAIGRRAERRGGPKPWTPPESSKDPAKASSKP
jgi:hypothetical protein